MDRGVFVGGGLICASFLLAVLLNEAARQPVRAPERAHEATPEEKSDCKRITPPSLEQAVTTQESASQAAHPPPSNCD